MNEKATAIKKYYNSLYKSENYGYNIQADSWLKKHSSYIPKGTALELGIGTGKNVPYLLEKGFTVEGIDLSDIAINKLKSKYIDKACKFWVDDINKVILPKEKYSLIICSMVLSHLTEEETITLLKKVDNALIDSGCVYLSTLSKDDPMYNHKFFEMTRDCASSIYNNQFLKRSFYDKNQIKTYFENYDIIELADILCKEPKRTTADGYFGLIMYLGKKTISLTTT